MSSIKRSNTRNGARKLVSPGIGFVLRNARSLGNKANREAVTNNASNPASQVAEAKGNPEAAQPPPTQSTSLASVSASSPSSSGVTTPIITPISTSPSPSNTQPVIPSLSFIEQPAHVTPSVFTPPPNFHYTSYKDASALLQIKKFSDELTFLSFAEKTLLSANVSVLQIPICLMHGAGHSKLHKVAVALEAMEDATISTPKEFFNVLRTKLTPLVRSREDPLEILERIFASKRDEKEDVTDFIARIQRQIIINKLDVIFSLLLSRTLIAVAREFNFDEQTRKNMEWHLVGMKVDSFDAVIGCCNELIARKMIPSKPMPSPIPLKDTSLSASLLIQNDVADINVVQDKGVPRDHPREVYHSNSFAHDKFNNESTHNNSYPFANDRSPNPRKSSYGNDSERRPDQRDRFRPKSRERTHSPCNCDCSHHQTRFSSSRPGNYESNRSFDRSPNHNHRKPSFNNRNRGGSHRRPSFRRDDRDYDERKSVRFDPRQRDSDRGNHGSYRNQRRDNSSHIHALDSAMHEHDVSFFEESENLDHDFDSISFNNIDRIRGYPTDNRTLRTAHLLFSAYPASVDWSRERPFKLSALVDTGAAVSLISERLFDLLCLHDEEHRRPSNFIAIDNSKIAITTANGQPLDCCGKFVMDMVPFHPHRQDLRGHRLTFYVCRSMKEDCILGWNVLTCMFDFSAVRDRHTGAAYRFIQQRYDVNRNFNYRSQSPPAQSQWSIAPTQSSVEFDSDSPSTLGSLRTNEFISLQPHSQYRILSTLYFSERRTHLDTDSPDSLEFICDPKFDEYRATGALELFVDRDEWVNLRQSKLSSLLPSGKFRMVVTFSNNTAKTVNVLANTVLGYVRGFYKGVQQAEPREVFSVDKIHNFPRISSIPQYRSFSSDTHSFPSDFHRLTTHSSKQHKSLSPFLSVLTHQPVTDSRRTVQTFTINSIDACAVDVCEVNRRNDEVRRAKKIRILDENVDVVKHLTLDQKSRLKTILQEKVDCFGIDLKDLKPAKVEKVSITLKEGIKSHFTPQFPLSVKDAEEVASQMKTLIEEGIVVPVDSPFNSPLMVARAEGRDPRVCINIARINDVTVSESLPMHSLSEVVERARGCRYFTVLDLFKGYFQLQMDDASIPILAFTLKHGENIGQYAYTRLPFGLKNAPAQFQRCVNEVLRGIQYKFAMSYIDDIIVFSKSFDEHLKHLSIVISRLSSFDLTIKLAKCKFAMQEVMYLGHILSEQGVRPNPEKVRVISEYPAPSNITELRRFLGLVNYFRAFIKNCSIICAPLYQNLRKDVSFEWSSKCESSFNRLKSSLSSAPVLIYPDLSAPFILETDGSRIGVGAVLLQHGDQSKTKLHVIAYASRSLNDHEAKYTTSEIELLAAVFGLTSFHQYLHGSKVTLITDHSAIINLVRNRIQDRHHRLARWLLLLTSYDCTVVYRKGSQNSVADALSRIKIHVSDLVKKRHDNEAKYSSASPDPTDDLLRDVNSVEFDDMYCESLCLWNISTRSILDSLNAQSDYLSFIDYDFLCDGYSVSNIMTRSERRKARNDEIASANQTVRQSSPHSEVKQADRRVPSSVPTSSSHSSTEPSLVPVQSTQPAQIPIPSLFQSPNAIPLPIQQSSSLSQSIPESKSRPEPEVDLSGWLLGDSDVKSPQSQVQPAEVNSPALPIPSNPNSSSQPNPSSIKPISDRTQSTFLDSSNDILNSNLIETIHAHQRSDPKLRMLIDFMEEGIVAPDNSEHVLEKIASNFIIDDTDNLLYFVHHTSANNSRVLYKIVLPSSLHNYMLQVFHDDKMTGGHYGTDKTYEHLRARFYWKNMFRTVSQYVQSCEVCAKSKPVRIPKFVGSSLTAVNVPMARIAVDYIGPLPCTSRGNEYILTVVDAFTRWPEAFPTKRASSMEFAKNFVYKVICRHGAPLELLSDRGTAFLSNLVKNINSIFRIDKVSTTSYNPSCNGMNEKFNGSLMHAILAYISQNPVEWDTHIDAVLFAYRTSVHSTTKFTPYELMHGRQALTPFDALLVSPSPELPAAHDVDASEYALAVKRRLSSAFDIVNRTHKEVQTAREAQNAVYAATHGFDIGDQVMLRNSVRSKLDPLFSDPIYFIVRRHNHISYDVKGPDRVVKNVNVRNIRLHKTRAELRVEQPLI